MGGDGALLRSTMRIPWDPHSAFPVPSLCLLAAVCRRHKGCATGLFLPFAASGPFSPTPKRPPR